MERQSSSSLNNKLQRIILDLEDLADNRSLDDTSANKIYEIIGSLKEINIYSTNY